ncbi:MAG: 50S ribosomal protein L9 [Candidatus Nomurabacteria bacterium GW2011_GWB1_37_5]|uniref:Large ribosomal subunit protein bL9 n=1 Tax=Candidatus Nomurabacteria bacterium GW2011_GWB1_37_5 TaxID=1618742 RepID=A0A0G0GWP6_9BACT|nr:MAG: 50S ribosomal protein L9 [Candidatus Nomurabacteria bacterium GW2011_GWB1_37_5]
MKIILLKDVPKVGRKYDIKEVSDGYALNALIPQKLAEKATPEKITKLEKVKKETLISKEAEEKELVKSLQAIKGIELIMKAKASDLPAGKAGKGHLFSSIHKKDMIEKMKKDYNISLNEEAIKIDAIKEIGEFEVPIEVNGKKSSFKLIVEKEN